MDPGDITSFNHCFAELSTSLGNRRYHFIDQKPKNYHPRSSRTLLLVHGFPDLSYGWRYQIGPWVRAGYRVVVPDCIGYGETDKPVGIENYTPKAVSEDLAALLDHLHISKVVLIGHDWGAVISWRFSAFYPSRVEALVTACVPYYTPARTYVKPQDVTKAAPNAGYREYFAEESATAEIQSKLYRFLTSIFRKAESMEQDPVQLFVVGNLAKIVRGEIKSGKGSDDLLSVEELEVYLRALTPGKGGGGVAGPLAYYKTGELRVIQERDLPTTFPASLPVLFLQATRDPTCTASHVERMTQFIPSLTVTRFECGHWIMVEKREEVSQTVTDWLDGVLRIAETAKM